MGEWISFIAGVVLFTVSCMVMKAYWPRKGRQWDAAFFLGAAIFLGFLATALNTFWWQIIVGAIDHYEVFPLRSLRALGFYLDGVLKGLSALAGVLHLVALRNKLPLPERRLYRWYNMPWYPRRLHMDSWHRVGEE